MRNKKTKSDYHKKRQLLTSYDFYKAKHKKLPVSKEEYQELKDEILILESRYPSIKKMGDDLVIRATLNYPDGRTYKGAIKSAEQQIPHGHGYMYLSATDINIESKTFGKKLTDNPWEYIGEFKDGVFDGQGEYKCEGNYSYKGEWKKSHFHGKGRYMDERTKEVYEGDFIKSIRNGYGVFIIENEFKLEGQFKNNDAHGKGKITILKDSENEEKGTTITGTFKKGLQQGLFEKVFPDGDIMDCMFVDSVCTKAKFRGDKKWTIYKK